MKFCCECVVHSSLKKLIIASGTNILRCRICGAFDTKATKIFSSRFRKTFRTLIRYYYSEWDYHGALGGSDIRDIFIDGNPILKSGGSMNEDRVWSYVADLTDPLIVDESKDINLLTAYGRDIYDCHPLEALEVKTHPFLVHISNELRQRNYFLLEDQVRSLIKPLLPKVERIVDIGETFFRARIGYVERAKLPEVTSQLRCHYKPFIGDDIGAPQPHISKSGRLNRAGVSFLYVTTNIETAIAEVRPHPGQQVTIGKFIVKRPLKVADFNEINFPIFAVNEDSLHSLHSVAAINRYLNEPITPERQSLYSLPQLLADVIRKEGYDAVMCNSSVSNGINVTAFDPTSLEYLDLSSNVYQVKEVLYKFTSESNIDDDIQYEARQKYSELDWPTESFNITTET